MFKGLFMEFQVTLYSFKELHAQVRFTIVPLSKGNDRNILIFDNFDIFII